MNKINNKLDETSKKILDKAYNTGAITNDEFSWIMSNMLIGDGYVLDTGSVENVNAEIVLRLKHKVGDLRSIFWKSKRLVKENK